MSFFVAVDPSDVVRAAVGDEIQRRSALTPATWLPPEKLHVTLLFLGDRRPPLGAALATIAAATSRFSLGLRGAGAFETARAPSVLWLGVGGQLDALASLRERLVEAFREVAPPTELQRPFVPHLTLARSKRPGHFDAILRELERFESPPFTVDCLTLYESSHGRFTALERAPLTGPSA
jgi:2'-5' RNA ligase